MAQNLKDIEIFAEGTWNGMKFTSDDLQEIAQNTQDLLVRGSNKPPLKLGHSTSQLLKGQSDGDPALGWIDNVRVVGKKLVADFLKVPDILVRAFKEGLYRQVSVEMRHLQEKGWFLTAVAVLGADLPAVKTLNDIEAFLSEQFKPDNAGIIENALCFTTTEPIISGDKMEKDQSQEIAALQAQLAEARRENETFKQREVESKFSAAKASILESYDADVKEGKLPPALRDKIAQSLDSQKMKFSEGIELNIPAELVKELTVSYSQQALPKQEVASNATFSESDEMRIDELIEKEIAQIQMSSNRTYEEASELLFSSKPELLDQWKQFTIDVSQGRL